ncbi:Trans-aconitate 2-methyltransferase [Apiospora marii]|uniref:Trans-aconitate 2-methyltransferase n=1 Tax=Apiospora marii TaxID=335849 RepID=A0ABR1RDC6_9PEZI
MAEFSSDEPSVTSQSRKEGGEGGSWSQAAPHYAGRLATSTVNAAKKMVNMALELKPPATPAESSQAPSRVLDAGAGSGAITETVRALDPDVPIVAVDKAPGMVEFLARKDIAGVTTGVADATVMVDQGPGQGQGHDEVLVPEGGFTHAFAALVVQFCGDRQQDLLTELFRAVVPGGVAGASITRDITIGEPWHRACERLLLATPDSDGQYRRFPTHDAPPAWMSTDQVEAGMRAAGFREIRTASLRLEFTWPSAGDYVRFWFEGGHPGLRKEMRG